MAKRLFHWSSVLDCVMHETDGDGNTLVTYTREPVQYGPLISEHRNGHEYVHHYDALGSTTMLTDETGSVTDTFTYDAWGNEVARTGTTETRYRWVGRWGYLYDEPTGSYYVRARVYQPTIARWVSIDPPWEITFARRRTFRNPQTLSSRSPTESDDSTDITPIRRLAPDFGYVLVSNDPIVWLDPSGLVKWNPAIDTGMDANPWGDPVSGDLMIVATDAGTKLIAWKPHDKKTYWCHGYTFDGYSAVGGPFSIYGDDVLTVLKDDGWIHECCGLAAGGIAIFGEAGGVVQHSGKISSVVYAGALFDEDSSQLTSKWGQDPLNTSSFAKNVTNYGKYKCYVKMEIVGCCPMPGNNEIEP